MNIHSGQICRLGPPQMRLGISRSGNRFVVLEGSLKGAYPGLDIGGHVVLKRLVVYDSPFRQPSYSFSVRRSKLKNPSWTALSPDGRYLAVLAYPKSVLEVFRLPPMPGRLPKTTAGAGSGAATEAYQSRTAGSVLHGPQTPRTKSAGGHLIWDPEPLAVHKCALRQEQKKLGGLLKNKAEQAYESRSHK